MTDATANQFAATIVAAEIAIASRANQIAFVMPTQETALAALLNQVSVVSVDVEYVIPLHLHGWLIQAIQGFPYYIEDDGL